MIQVNLLGTPSVSDDGRPVKFKYAKAEGLFYILCVEKTISRSKAASLLWADCDDITARKNLRNALYHIKLVLGNEIVNTSGKNGLSLNAELVSSDYDQISEDTILSLYNGDFLSFFYIRNCMEFESWSDRRRRSCRLMFEHAALSKTEQLIEEEQDTELRLLSALLLKNSVHDESIYRRIMQFYFEKDRYYEAVQLYHKLVDLLHLELDAKPEKSTEELYREILKHRTGSLKTEGSGTGSDLKLRHREFEQIMAVYRDFSKEHSRNHDHDVLVLGESGVGKSALLGQAADCALDNAVITVFEKCDSNDSTLPFLSMLRILQKAELHLKHRVSDVKSAFRDYPAGMKAMWLALLEQYRQEGLKLFIIIDDIRYMDEESFSSLKEGMKKQADTCMLLASCRENTFPVRSGNNEPEKELTFHQKIYLKNFTYSETVEYIGTLYPDIKMNSTEKKQLFLVSGGNAAMLNRILNVLSETESRDTVTGTALKYWILQAQKKGETV